MFLVVITGSVKIATGVAVSALNPTGQRNNVQTSYVSLIFAIDSYVFSVTLQEYSILLKSVWFL